MKDLLRGIGKDEFIIKFDPADLLIGEDVPVEVWLLDIQQGKELYGVLALERSLLSCDAHLFSLLRLK